MSPRLSRTGPVPPYQRLAAMRTHSSPILGPILRRLADDLDPAIGNKTLLWLSKTMGVSFPSLSRLFHQDDPDTRVKVLERIATHYGLGVVTLTDSHGKPSGKSPQKTPATGRTTSTSRR